MINQDAQFEELPEYWKGKIRQYRRENHNLRARLRDVEKLSDLGLSASWANVVRKLRAENAKMRVERKELRAELDALRSELGQP